jgi:PKD repeat protein
MQRIIYIPLLVIALVSAVMLIVIKVRTPGCSGLSFHVPASARADEKIALIDSTPDAKSWLWDFGDSTDAASDKAPTHRYKQPGKYIVSLTVNGACKDIHEIEIFPKPAIHLQLAQIQGPSDAVYVGDRVPFSEMTPDATSWEWTFGESGKVDARDKQASYVFHSAGYKTVTVYANTPSGKLSGSFTVNVRNKEAAAAAPIITPKAIAGAAKPTGAAKKALFESKFNAFLTQPDLSVRTKIFNEMEQLICSPAIQVLWITPALKKNKKKSFADFCQGIIGDKDVYSVSELTVDFDMAKDCVSNVTVKMKAK